MFWFQHPRPPSRKEVAEQVVENKQAALPGLRVLIVERPRAKEEVVVQPPPHRPREDGGPMRNDNEALTKSTCSIVANAASI